MPSPYLRHRGGAEAPRVSSPYPRGKKGCEGGGAEAPDCQVHAPSALGWGAEGFQAAQSIPPKRCERGRAAGPWLSQVHPWAPGAGRGPPGCRVHTPTRCVVFSGKPTGQVPRFKLTDYDVKVLWVWQFCGFKLFSDANRSSQIRKKVQWFSKKWFPKPSPSSQIFPSSFS